MRPELEAEARAAGREIGRTMGRYLWAWTWSAIAVGLGFGLFIAIDRPYVGGLTMTVGILALVGIAAAVRARIREETPPPDARSEEERLGAQVYDSATGDLPISFTLSEMGRAEMNRATLRLGITRERAVAEAMGNFLKRYGQQEKRGAS